jgi:hypothetical protein
MGFGTRSVAILATEFPGPLDDRKIRISVPAMRPLKPYVLALGGLIAAVFSAVFLGGQHAAARSIIPTTSPQPDLQAKRPAAPVDVVAGRDGKLARKTPDPQPAFPAADFASDGVASVSVPPSLEFSARPMPRERFADQRPLLLVGTVELRI